MTTVEQRTWGDIGAHALALQTALSICADQVATLSQWRQRAQIKHHFRAFHRVKGRQSLPMTHLNKYR